MAYLTALYNNNVIAEWTTISGTKNFLTANKYCSSNITLSHAPTHPEENNLLKGTINASNIYNSITKVGNGAF